MALNSFVSKARKLLLSTALAAATTLGVATPITAEAQSIRRVITFYNACPQPIQFLINHADNGPNWHVHGWYRLAPYQRSTFSAHGTTLTQSDGYQLYVYGETTSGPYIEWKGSNFQPYGSATYPFKTWNTVRRSDGSLSATFTC